MNNETAALTLKLNVLRHADGMDCTNKGITSTHTELRLVGYVVDTGERVRVKDLPVGVMMTYPDAAPVLLVIRSSVDGFIAHLTPAHWDEETGQWTRGGEWTMFGGNFAHSSDSRFTSFVSRLLGVRFYGALAVHDRIER